eukprot:EG_transcript_10322
MPVLATSNAGKFRDSMPHIPAAGKVLTDPNDGTDKCMQSGRLQRATTPPEVQPFRRGHIHELGRSTVHYGKARDPQPPDMRFGRTSKYVDSAKVLMAPNTESTFMEHMQALKEASKPLYGNDPLGKTANKFNIQLPDKCKDPNYRFGSQSNPSESAKVLIYPPTDPFDDPDPATHELYVKSHGRFEAGEQRNLGYNWLAHGIDPTSFRFGLVQPHEQTGVADALKPEDARLARSVLVKKEVEDSKDVTHDALGQVKNYGFGAGQPKDAGAVPEATFGRASRWDEWDAVRLIRGDYTQEEQAPDQDLGRSKHVTRRGYQPPTQSPERPGGLPTVRLDIAKPKVKRVTDFQNYGDEVNADRLIYPSVYAPILVHEEDFTKGYDRAFMWDLQQTAGIGLDQAAFDAVWEKAATTGPVSVETFRHAMAALDL